MSLLRTEAIIMKGMDLGEADRIITLFTREKGKIRAVANGVRRIRSSLGALVQPFTYGTFSLYMGGSIPRFRQGDILASFSFLREDLLTMTATSYLMELMDTQLGEEDPHEAIFVLLLQVMEMLASHGYRDLFLRAFEIRCMSLLGYQPQLHNCIQCERSLGERETMYFSSALGGIRCGRCPRQSGDQHMGPGTLNVLQRLLLSPLRNLQNLTVSPATEKELEILMEKYILYHGEKEMKTMGFLRSLKNSSP